MTKRYYMKLLSFNGGNL